MVKLKIDLSQDFFKEEVRCDYSVSKEMKEIWAVELDLLAEFMRVCDKNDIQYYACAGTILGAERHQGYIPWDDDIDVMMMRKEYDKLCAIAETEFKHPYFFQTEYNDRGTLRGHAQLRNSETTGILIWEAPCKFKFNQGIFLDIFPLDAVPDNEKVFDRQLKRAKKYRDRAWRIASLTDRYLINTNSFLKRYVKAGLHICLRGMLNKYTNYDEYYKKYEEVCSQYNNEKTENVAMYFQIPMNKKRCVWPKKDFEDVVYLPFEFLTVPVPSGYIDILDRFYGNWHEYVRGTSIHGGVIFDVNVSYDQFLEDKKQGLLNKGK